MGEVETYFYLRQLHSGEVWFKDSIQPKKAVEYLTESFEAGNFSGRERVS